MDMEQIESLLKMRDSLVESMPYAAPEELATINRSVQKIMWRVIKLMGYVEWVG